LFLSCLSSDLSADFLPECLSDLSAACLSAACEPLPWRCRVAASTANVATTKLAHASAATRADRYRRINSDFPPTPSKRPFPQNCRSARAASICGRCDLKIWAEKRCRGGLPGAQIRHGQGGTLADVKPLQRGSTGISRESKVPALQRLRHPQSDFLCRMVRS
jgi:hypothetical protein